MSTFNRNGFAWCCAMIFGIRCATPAHASPIFSDTFDSGAIYNGGTSTGTYTASDENTSIQGAWVAGGGALVYGRANTGQDPSYHYGSSVVLTSGATAATGNTAGLALFTIAGILNDIPSVNTAQPGLIVSGSLGAGPGTGGYLLEVDNGLNQGPGSPFALLALTGTALLSDEGSGAVVQNFGIPTTGDSYSVSVAVDRTAANPDLTGSIGFTVNIVDLTANTTFYSGTFSYLQTSPNFSGTQIGYRVRDPLDAEMPSFGALSLSVPAPEPTSIGVFALTGLATFLRRESRRFRK